MLLVSISCKKERVELSTSSVTSLLTHIPLAVGNYWLYENYRIDTSLGTQKLMVQMDSIVITKDTTINNKEYFVRRGEKFSNGVGFKLIDCIRDSSGYLVNSDGLILFAENNFTDTIYKWSNPGINSNYITSYSLMEVLSQPITTSVGTFNNGLNALETITQHNYSPALIRKADHIYIKNVGLAFEMLYTSAWIDGWIEKRLVHYHLN
jgi:hypothetical protein